MAFVRALLSSTAIPLREREKALDRAFADPGVPDTKQTTSSFWLQEPHSRLAKIQSPSLPTKADVVIIGSGITAASVAKTILESGQLKTNDRSTPAVVILEARDICSGATGRNGGHILETAEEFSSLEEQFGLEEAKKIMKFKLSHLNELLKVAEEYGLTESVQARNVQFLSAYFDQETWMEGKKSIERFKLCMPQDSVEWRNFEGENIPKDFRLPHARGVITGPAGALWPYRFITGIFDRLQERFCHDFLIETNTPVTEIRMTEPNSDLDRCYSITTPRGVVNSRHVIHCTNAHVGHLVPGLRGCIYAIRGQMSAQNPGQKFPSQGNEHSWIFNYQKGFDYLTQLPNDKLSNGEMMFGGGFSQGESSGISDLGISTDSGLSLYADIHLSGALSSIFGRENWGPVSGPSVKKMWTGSMGFSADGLPWVGRLPQSLTNRGVDGNIKEKKGAEWVCAAFSGEGMVNAWLCGKALGLMLLSHDGHVFPVRSNDLSWFPEDMLVSTKRVKESVLERAAVGERMTSSKARDELSHL